MDVLQEHLTRARATGGVFARSVAVPPWGLRLPGTIQLAVHTVTRGRAWIWTQGGGEPVELAPGDLVLVRGGPDHFIAHEAGAPCLEHVEFWARPPVPDDSLGDRGTVFFCGAYQFAGDIGRGLIDALPPVLLLPADVDDPVHAVVTLLSRELTHHQPGKQTVLDRLLDVLVVLALRAGLARSGTAPAWVSAATDPRLTAALEAVHTHGEEPWTVEDLAAMSSMSRATFARTFRQALGQSPMRYLTDWRMTMARDLLLDAERSLTDVAREVGYSSAYAFATAFRRHHGEPPGRWRQRPRDAGRLPGDAVDGPSAEH